MTPKQSNFGFLLATTSAALLIFSMLAMVFVPAFEYRPRIEAISFIFISLEFFVYLFCLLLAFQRVELMDAMFLAALLAVSRGSAALVAAFTAYNFSFAPDYLGGAELVLPVTVWTSLWLGNPAMISLQVLLLTAISLPVLAALVPRMVGLPGGSAAPDTGERAKVVNLPVGGYIQCYSYSDVHDCIRKLPGVKGFALATTEGLIVTGEGHDLPFPLESAVPRLQIGTTILRDHQERSGMPLEEFWQFTDDFTLIMVTMDPCFFLLIFLETSSDLADLRPRISSVRKSAENFLSERHRLLMPEADSA